MLRYRQPYQPPDAPTDLSPQLDPAQSELKSAQMSLTKTRENSSKASTRIVAKLM
jgi:hypothetical protein